MPLADCQSPSWKRGLVVPGPGGVAGASRRGEGGGAPPPDAARGVGGGKGGVAPAAERDMGVEAADDDRLLVVRAEPRALGHARVERDDAERLVAEPLGLLRDDARDVIVVLDVGVTRAHGLARRR